MKINRYLLTAVSLLTFGTLTPTLLADDYNWTGEGANNNFSSSENWDPAVPPANSSGDPMDLYFGSSSEGQIHLNRAVRYRNMYFSGQDYWIEQDPESAGYNITNSTNNGGVHVDGVNVVISANEMHFNGTTGGSPGVFSVANGGSLTVSLDKVTLSASPGNTAERALRFAGDGEITINAAFTGNGLNSSTLQVHQDFSGIVRLNSAGSTISNSNLVHAGTGTVEFGADDAIGTNGIQFTNTAGTARVQAGNGARTLDNHVEVRAGFIVSGENALTFSAGTDFGSTNSTINVEESAGRLVLAGELTGTGSAVITFDGSGVTEITGDNADSLSHTVLVADGGLQVSNATGSATGSGPLQIGPNAFIFGNGRVASNAGIQVSGQVRLTEEEALRFGGDVTLEDGSTVFLGSTGAAGFIEGDLFISSGVEVVLDSSGDWQVGQTYRIFDLEDGTVTGELSLAGGYDGLFTYQDGLDGFVEFELTAIPEPGQLALLFGGVVIAVVVLRQRRR